MSKTLFSLSMLFLLSGCATSPSDDYILQSTHDKSLAMCQSALAGAIPGVGIDQIKQACFDKHHRAGRYAQACVNLYKSERPSEYARWSTSLQDQLPLLCALRDKRLHAQGLDVDFYDRVTAIYQQ